MDDDGDEKEEVASSRRSCWPPPHPQWISGSGRLTLAVLMTMALHMEE
jgi:hypothetical protein